MSSEMPSGPPYPSTTAGIGGLPNTSLDRILTSVFLVLFALGAATHMTILQLNLRRSHKFLASGAIFGFCMSRIVTTTMRLVWGTYPTNVRVAIAANIFVSAGVLIIIIINIIFAQRVLRASHPKFGWSRFVHFAFIAYYASLILNLAMLITSIVQQTYTLDPNTLRIDHDLLLTGSTYTTVASLLPFPIMILSTLTRHVRPRSNPAQRVEKFGTGRFRSKLAILFTGATLIATGAVFRCVTAYYPRPAADPAWYHSKACFYVFNFSVEIVTVYLYAIIRVDRRFHIPNGSKQAGDYVNGTGQNANDEKPGDELNAGRPEMVLETEEEMERDFAPEVDYPEADVEKARDPEVAVTHERMTDGSSTSAQETEVPFSVWRNENGTESKDPVHA